MNTVKLRRIKLKFTIITICKNSKYNIRKTVESVLMQKSQEYEYIIIDGASDDGTLDILHLYDRPELQIYSAVDNGISDAFNKGIEKASGEFLFFLNSGDFFVKDDVLNMAESYIERHNAEIYTFAISTLSFPCWPKDLQHGLTMWNESLIPHQATFIHRSVFERVGLFNEHFKVRMDYDFFCRCKKAHIKFFCHPEVITHYDENGISATNRYLHDKEGLAVQLLYKDTIDKAVKETIKNLLKEDTPVENSVDQNEITKMRISVAKKSKLIQAMDRWISLLHGQKSISGYLKNHSMRKVAIYGKGYLGRNLKTELEQNNIEVLYFIDQYKKGKGIYSWDDDWDIVDCIIVTPFDSYKEICSKIYEKGFYHIVSFGELLSCADDLTGECSYEK